MFGDILKQMKRMSKIGHDFVSFRIRLYMGYHVVCVLCVFPRQLHVHCNIYMERNMKALFGLGMERR